MSGPRRGKRRRASGRKITRREFLKRSSLASAGLVVAALPACSGDGADTQRGVSVPNRVRFLHGVASGDPQTDRVILWTRVTLDEPASPIPVQYLLATDPALASVITRGVFVTGPERDYTVNVDVTGLAAGTTYFYQFKAGNAVSAVGRTRTLPAGSIERLRIGVLSCASYAHGLFNATRRVAERPDLDLVLFLGDYIYEYSSGADDKPVYGTFRTYEPPTEIESLDDYRKRHAQYKTDPDLMELHRQHAVVAIWDDHETADNAWKGGAVNHNEDGKEGDWDKRVSVALQAYYEWMPVRQLDPARPRHFYRSFRLGDLAEIVLLEERLLARDEQHPGAIDVQGAEVGFVPVEQVVPNNRDMLGEEQETWLKDTLRSTPARWKLLGHGVMLSQFKLTGLPNAVPGSVYINPDQWDGYPAARSRLYDIIDGRDGGPPVANVVSLAADVHCSWSNDLARDPNNPNAAAGGYDRGSGAGALAVEFVATSVSAAGLEAVASLQRAVPVMNPQVRYVDFSRRGYLLLDVTSERLVGEHWYVPTITEVSSDQSFGAAFQVAAGSAHLVSTAQTEPAAARPTAP